MNSLVKLINVLVQKTLILMMTMIVVTVTWQVFSRFILASPSSFTEELSRFLLIWIGMLGAAYAYHTRAHLGLDLFVNKCPPTKKRSLMISIELMVLIFASTILVFGGTSLVAMTLELKQTSAALEVQVGLVYLVVPISGVLICMYSVDNLLRLLRFTTTPIQESR